MVKRNKSLMIPDGWIETKLGEIVDYLNRGISPSYNDHGVLVINQKCIRNGKVSLDEARYSDPFLKKIPEAKFIKHEDILICSTGVGTLGRVSQIKFPDNNITADSHVTIVRPNDFVDKRFIGYLLKKSEIEIESLAEGSTGQTELQKSRLMRLPILLPPLSQQKEIADILSSFDDKIELLREENKTLEAIAQTIFKEWFVDFNFPDENGKPYKSSGGKMIASELGEIPEDWRVGSMGEVIKICGGSTPNTKESLFWNGNINWTSPKDLANNKEIFLTNTENKITIDGLKQISSGLLPRGTLLLSSRAPIGYIAITDISVAINQGYIAFLPTGFLSNEFMYFWLKTNLEIILSCSNGSTFLEISKGTFRNINLIISPDRELESFQKISIPIFRKILTNIYQIQSLCAIRDELLPKLMKGKMLIT